MTQCPMATESTRTKAGKPKRSNIFGRWSLGLGHSLVIASLGHWSFTGHWSFRWLRAFQQRVFHKSVAKHMADAHLGIFDPAIVSGIDNDDLAGQVGQAAA